MWVSFGKIRIVGLKKNIINKRFLQNKLIDHWVGGEGWYQHAGEEVKTIYAKNVEEEGQ